MVIGGLWHGANWTFVVWGAIHGGGLAVERYRRLIAASGSVCPSRPTRSPDGRANGCSRSTSSASAWVFFRASGRSRIAFDMLGQLVTGWGRAHRSSRRW